MFVLVTRVMGENVVNHPLVIIPVHLMDVSTEIVLDQTNVPVKRVTLDLVVMYPTLRAVE